MNWWKQWKWFKKQGIANYYFYDTIISDTTYFYYIDGEKKVNIGSLRIRRNWIEKL